MNKKDDIDIVQLTILLGIKGYGSKDKDADSLRIWLEFIVLHGYYQSPNKKETFE